jgi:VanZ family protein
MLRVVLMSSAALLLFLPSSCPAEHGLRLRVRNNSDFEKALARAQPGTEIVLLPGNYTGGVTIRRLQGAPAAPIRIRAALTDRPPVFRGGPYGLRLSSVADLVLEGLVIEQATECGVLIDDHDEPSTPARQVQLVDVVVRDLADSADGIRLAGVHDFELAGCHVARWSSQGQAIRLTDCRRGRIAGCRLDSGERGAVGVAVHGLSADIFITHTTFIGMARHGLECACSNRQAAPSVEQQATVVVRDCQFCKVAATAAFVGGSGGVIEHNVIYRPRECLLRFLPPAEPKTTAIAVPRRFAENVVVWRNGETQAFAERHHNVDAASPQLLRNYWYCDNAPLFSRLATEPFVEHDGVYGEDPQLFAPEECDLRPLRPRQALRHESNQRPLWLQQVFLLPAGQKQRLLCVVVAAAVLALAWWVAHEHRKLLAAAEMTGGARTTERCASAGVEVLPRGAGMPATSTSGMPASPYSPVGLFAATAVTVALFFVYGSLLPFNYQPLEFTVAVKQFRQIPYLQIGVEHLADWMANLLLFVPISYCATATISVNLHFWLLRVSGALCVWLLCAALSLGVEFLQLWFPGRTVSQNDLLAEGLGAAAGCVLALGTVDLVTKQLRVMVSATRPTQVLDFFLAVYALGFICYEVMPLDVAVSPAVLWEKWEQGRISLWAAGTLLSQWQDLLDHLLLCVPLGVYLRRFDSRSRESTGSPLLRMLSVAALIEVAQVFVYSRDASVTSGLVATAGMLVGGCLARFISPDFDNAWDPEAAARRRFLTVTGVTVYLAILVWRIVDPPLLDSSIFGWERLPSYWQIPFASLYSGSDFHALQYISKAILIFVPLGFLFGDLAISARTRSRGVTSDLLAGAALGFWATVVELLQAWRPESVLDVTSTICYLIGGFAGLLSRRLLARAANNSGSFALIRPAQQFPQAPLWACALAAAAVVGLVGWGLPALLWWITG